MTLPPMTSFYNEAVMLIINHKIDRHRFIYKGGGFYNSIRYGYGEKYNILILGTTIELATKEIVMTLSNEI